LHAPSLPSTQHMIDARRLSLMKDGATLINTARGILIDDAALLSALKTGRIDAVLDVTDPEIPEAVVSDRFALHRMGPIAVAI
ncbi:NAD(P)-dependent oxidoreductase, partial [Rhizobium ruizarguesonis]